jgi:hypothetical protein
MKLEKYLKMVDEYPSLFVDDDSLIKIIKDETVIRNWQVDHRKTLIEKRHYRKSHYLA